MAIKAGDLVTVKRTTLIRGELAEQPHPEKARVMSICEGYAMLRYKRCMPFVLSVKDLDRWNSDSPTRDQVPADD